MKGFETKEEVENAAILDISLYVHNDSEWQVAKRAWMTGFATGVRVAEEHAKFASSVNAYQNMEDDK